MMYDEGAGLFAGLNTLLKTTYAIDYSYQTERPMNERLVDELTRWLPLKEPPLCFSLDFHAIPFRGQRRIWKTIGSLGITVGYPNIIVVIESR